MERKARELGFQRVPQIPTGAMKRLIEYSWPGNVRKLENVVEREMIRSTSGVLTFEDILPPSKKQQTVGSAPPQFQPQALDAVISGHIEETLRLTQGKVQGPDGAANLLGVHASTLRNRMDHLGIIYGRKYRRSVHSDDT